MINDSCMNAVLEKINTLITYASYQGVCYMVGGFCEAQ